MKSHNWRDVYILAGLLLLTFLARIPSLEEPFDNDSSANAYHARLILRGEPLYGTHHPAHHMPGVSYTYALAFVLFGESDFSVKLLLIPWIGLTAWMIFRLGEKFQGSLVGGTSAVLFIMLTSQLNLKGTTAEVELFANLPIVWAISLALQFADSKERLSRLFWAGVMFGFVLAYKVSLILFLLVVGMELLVIFWQEIRSTGKWQRPLLNLAYRNLIILIGIVVVIIPFLGLFAWQGVLDRFLLTFSLGQGYLSFSNSLPAYRIILIPLIILAYNNAALLVFGLAGMLRLVYSFQKQGSKLTTYSVVLIVWLLASFLITGVTRVGYVHYALVAVPPLTLIAAWEIYSISRQLIERLKLKGRLHILPYAAIFTVVAISSLVFNYHSPYHYLRYRLGLESFDEFLSEGTIEGSSLVNSLNVAKYIAQNTNPDDYIFTWSEAPQVYFYSGRRSPIETIWPYYVTAFGPYQRIFVPQTKYIILGHSIYLEIPEWMLNELKKSYELETEIGEYKLYRRNVP